MIKIIQDHENCISCGTCVALCPNGWEWGQDGKAVPKDGKRREDGNYEREVNEIGCNKDAADACPVQVIKIEEAKK